MANRTELWTRSLVFDSKRYHIDLQENARGVYMKLTEVRQNGERSSVIMPSAVLAGASYLLHGHAAPRRFRSLCSRCTSSAAERCLVTQSPPALRVPLHNSRPAQTAFRTALDRTIDEDYARPADPSSGPNGRSMQLCSKLCQAGPKRFFFDTMQNDRGRFMKASDDATTRCAVPLPRVC